MIQVTYDEYKQYYMKHDTWALSSWKKKRKGEVGEQRCRRAPLFYLFFSSKS